jgi:hypothetical protein
VGEREREIRQHDKDSVGTGCKKIPFCTLDSLSLLVYDAELLEIEHAHFILLFIGISWDRR